VAVTQIFKCLTGLPALHLLPIDPLAVTKITIEDGTGRPVRLNLEFHNVKTIGFSTSEIKTIRSVLWLRQLYLMGLSKHFECQWKPCLNSVTLLCISLE